MTLISLLLVLAIERVATQSQYWQPDVYFNYYQTLITKRGWLSESTSGGLLLGLTVLPSIILFILLHSIGNNLFGFIFSTAALMVCIGCPSLRVIYKAYLQAANRGDLQACSMYADQLGYDEQSNLSFGQNLVWLNYRHYVAVVLFYLLLGAPGAVFYVIARSFQVYLAEQNSATVVHADKLMHVLDWVPVRITALGFLLVGHFSRAFPVWLNYLPDPAIPAKRLLADVSRNAEEIEPDEHDCTEEPCTLVRLAKRNLMFILVIISILTLSGWVN